MFTVTHRYQVRNEEVLRRTGVIRKLVVRVEERVM